MKRKIELFVAGLALAGVGTVISTGRLAAYQAPSHTITIIDEDMRTQYETPEVYLNEFLDANDIELSDYDVIYPSLDTELQDGMRITIERWNPQVEIILNGKSETIQTQEYMVADLLRSEEIVLKENDQINVALNEIIKDGMEIEINTYETGRKIVEMPVPFTTEIHKTTSLPEGSSEIISDGAEGVKRQTIEVVYFGGKVKEEILLSTEIVEQPRPQVIVEGSAVEQVYIPAPTPEPVYIPQPTQPKQPTQQVNSGKTITWGGKTYEYTQKLNMEATAYTHQPGDRWYNKTASGMPTFVGMVAVDRDQISLGTVLYVEDYGIAIAGDVGGAIDWNDIDLYFNSTSEVYNFGRQYKNVYILKDQSIDVQALRGA
ncbi:hypothetical protein AN639_04625 [Candidatus Epulonipiscium fishelsonii]|uniref:Uncharacterized protein n=1 Tax=Candidatus Epulonipiscium fishelsonii TaxID=77094 RepID=A0ACC8XEQ0_9FIRM|nr:hypothetical protein AN639_04625 [Epulopiscium sp. SCG-B05WGA-EpuloA1]ONI41520.1 hypothetical protein AN396_03490 [Epulopiscium sp. SCG-B11WGA-EpuloA1]